jgi:hypothetical protein
MCSNRLIGENPMVYALIVPDKFNNASFLASILDAITCSKIVAGTSNSFKLLEEYIMSSQRDIIISKAEKGKTPPERTYNAINEAKKVIIFTHKNGIKSKKAIQYAQSCQKPIIQHCVEL